MRRVTLLSMVCQSVQNCTHFLITVPVCVCTLNYPVSNNHTTCYIAVYGLSIGTKLYTFSYHRTSFKNFTEYKICVLRCSANLSINFPI